MVRFKNRWLLVEFIPCSPDSNKREMNAKQIWAALKQSVVQNFGDTGWGAVGLSLTVKYYSPTTNVCIIRVARDHHNLAWGAVTLLSLIEGQKYIPNVVHLSGTIKHAQLAAIQHNREVVARFRARAKNTASFEDYLTVSTAEIGALQD